jgi:hypothetical protein
MKLTFCCEPFKALIENAGEKGISIVPRVRDGNRQFFIQARPFERHAVALLSAIDPATGENKWPSLDAVTGEVTPFVTVLMLPLKCCPACGRNLNSVIEQDVRAFDEIAKEAVHLWDE